MKKILSVLALLVVALTVTAQTKLVDDGLAPNGSTIPAKAFTIDWETQKIVANLDMSAEDGTNANTMSFSDNEADLAEWNVSKGYTLHFFYTNANYVWTTNDKTEYLTHCFTIQLRNSADLSTTPTVYVKNVADPANVSIEITKDGVYVDGELKMAASEIEAFYAKSDLFFGSLQGENRSKAVYKSVEVQNIDNGGGEEPEPGIEGTVVEGSKDFAAGGQEFEWSDVAINWDKQKLVAVIDLSTCGDATQNENILSVGEDVGAWKIGGWHFYYTKATGRMKVDYLTTGGSHPLSTAKTGVSADNEIKIEFSKENGVTINGEAYLDNYDTSITGTWQENTADFWNLLKVNIGSKEGNTRSNATIKYVTVVDLQTETPEPTEPTEVFTDKAHATYEGEFDYTDKKVEVYDLGEGKSKVVYKEYNLGDTTFDLVYDDVTTATEDGVTTYSFDGKATIENLTVPTGTMAMVSEGEVDAKLEGKSSEGKLFATFTVKISATSTNSVTVFGEDNETPEPPTPSEGGLIDAGYQPAGSAWSKSATIDWDKQYVKAVIDLSNCKYSFENILSVGESISGWDDAPHYHFYYTASTKSLQFNGMTQGKNNSRYDITLDSDELTIEISKEKGLVINGTQYLNQYSTTTQYELEDYLTAMADFFALTEIEFGACQGSTFSNATYKYFNVLDLPKDPTNIKDINADTNDGKAEIYTVGGAKVNSLQKGINIVRYANGKTVKVLK